MADGDPELEFDFTSILPQEEEPTMEELVTPTQKPGWKPFIGNLPSAVDGETLLVKERDKILIEYTQSPWRDTTVWIVAAIEPEGTQKGHLRLFDPNKNQYGATNYLQADEHGLVIKIPDPKQRWVPGEDESLVDRIKHHYRKPRIEEQPSVEDSQPKKRRVGRPPGSKNQD